MIDTDKPIFLQTIARLAVAHREKKPDAVLMRVYFDVLKPSEIEFVVEAAERLMIGEFFPKAGAWLKAAQAIERERTEAQWAMLRTLPEPLCPACADTGWLPVGPGRTLHGREAASRATPCECQELRRLELLGRQPVPMLPAHTEPPDAGQLAQAEAMAASLASRKQMAAPGYCAHCADDFAGAASDAEERTQ